MVWILQKDALHVMRTLAEFNGIRDPKINLTQVC
jgi:hypothetical protein